MKTLETLFEITVYSWVIYGATVALKRCFRNKMSPLMHYAVWLLLVLRLMVPVTLTSSVHLIPLPAATVRPAVTAPALPTPAPVVLTAQAPAPAPAARPDPGKAASYQPVAPARPAEAVPAPVRINWPRVAVGVWLAGAGAGLVYLAALYALFWWRIRRAAPPSRRLTAALHEARAELGIRAPIPVVCPPVYGTPALLFPRTLLMPMDALLTMDDRQLRYALRHELTHYKRGDQVVCLLLCVLNAVWWFNPLVWVACRQIRADMEAACDSAVTRALSPDEKARYAFMILSLIRRRPVPVALGMAQRSTRRGVERRIRCIFSASRSRPGARLAAGVLALVLLVGCFTTACQPTPSDVAVQEKGGGALEQAIAGPASTDRHQGAAPDHYTAEFSGAEDTVSVVIDAAVHTQAGALPVVQVKPRAIPMEQVKAMAQVLFQGHTAYEPKTRLTKAEIEKKILDIRQFLSDEDAMLEYYGGQQEVVDAKKAQLEARIAAYEAQYATAPETVERKETDWVFRPAAYYNDMVEVESEAGADAQSPLFRDEYYASDTIILESRFDGYYAQLYVNNLETGNRVEHIAGFIMGSESTEAESLWSVEARPMTLTREETVAMVEDALQRMGIKGMRLMECRAYGRPQPYTVPDQGLGEEGNALAAAAGEGVEPPAEPTEPPEGEVYNYTLTFTPTYKGIAVVDTGQYITRTMDPYGPTYPYETLWVRVQNDIITVLTWSSPVETVAVENENVSILSLDEAAAAFRNRMQQEYTLSKLIRETTQYGGYKQYEDRIVSGRITVTDIRLGLMRIRVKDRPGIYRMVPVWTFAGTEQLGLADGDDPLPGPRTRDGALTYAVVNAVDGSIIDPALGY